MFYRVIEHFFKTDPKFLFEWISSDTGRRVLHYTCLYSQKSKETMISICHTLSYGLTLFCVKKLVRLLLNQPYLKVKAKAAGSSSLIRLEKILETVDKFWRTPLLDSCRFKSSATIQLLVKADADLKGIDKDDNTAIILVASSSSNDLVPTKQDSPGLFKK